MLFVDSVYLIQPVGQASMYGSAKSRQIAMVKFKGMKNYNALHWHASLVKNIITFGQMFFRLLLYYAKVVEQRDVIVFVGDPIFLIDQLNT